MGISSQVETFLLDTLDQARELKNNAMGETATDDARILVRVESVISDRLKMKDKFGALRKKSKSKSKSKSQKKKQKKKRTKRRRR